MIEFLESGTDVLAVRITGKLAHDELQTVTERLERSLNAQEKTHVFVELVDYDGFPWSALGDYLPRAAKLLGQLERFGRVAIVTDIGWIRLAARVESALLPGIRYELFTPDERAQALAWVEGRSELPHRAATTLLTTDDPDVFGFALSGRIGAEEMHRLVARVRKLLDGRPGPVRVLGRFTALSLPEPGGIDAEFVKMKLSALARVERYAVVGGPPWLAGILAALAPLLKLEMRHFGAGEEAEAWGWLGARLVGEVGVGEEGVGEAT